MAYFPMFIELNHKKGLVIGGGKVALRKLQKLLPFGAELSAAAPDFLPEIEALPNVTLLRQTFTPSLLQGMDFVILATDERICQQEASRLCREQGIPVNVDDCMEESTFLFPALVQRGPLTIGITTSGASPAASALLRQNIEQALPDCTEELLDWLASLRPEAKQLLPDSAARGRFFKQTLSEALALGRPLKAEELAPIYAQT